jgi:hypothetical protein
MGRLKRRVISSNVRAAMRKFLLTLATVILAFAITGCLTTPVEKVGGRNGATVTNSNPGAIITAAQQVFPQYGYRTATVAYPDFVAFDKPGGAFDQAMWGGFGQTTTVRVRMYILPLTGTNNYRLKTSVFAVSDAGEVGFESKRQLAGMWEKEFGPLLQQVASRASNIGP